MLLAVAVLLVTIANRVVLLRVDLPDDLAYLLVGRLAAGGGTWELPYEAPWLVLPVLALVLFILRPTASSWAGVVLTFALPHAVPYRVGPIELWGVRLLETSPAALQLLHLPLALLLGVLVVLALDRGAPAPVSPRAAGPISAAQRPTAPRDPPAPRG